MIRAERRAAVGAKGPCVTATRYPQLVLKPPNLNDSAEEVVHDSKREYTTQFCHGREKLIKYRPDGDDEAPGARGQ